MGREMEVEEIKEMQTKVVRITSKPLARFNLTKKIFMSLQPRLFLMSNVYDKFDGHCFPAFADYVSGLSERDSQWKTICESNAKYRLADLWPSLAT
jgi:hypothetical protein